jgi:hypothetical protein
MSVAEEQVEVSSLLSNLISQARNNEPMTWIPDEKLRLGDASSLVAMLSGYEKDPHWTVRYITSFYQVRLTKLHPARQDIREQVTDLLVNAMIDPNADLSPHPCKWLLSFQAKDFSEEAKGQIVQALQGSKPSKELVLVSGAAQVETALPRLEEFIFDEAGYRNDPNKRHCPKWYHTMGWNARLARARMGVESDIDRCLELVETVEDLDRRVLTLLDDVGYIRQPQAIEHLKKYLESNERLSPVKPSAPGGLVANHVMSILAEALSDYPVKRREGRNYTEDEIELSCKWMAEQKQWNIIR